MSLNNFNESQIENDKDEIHKIKLNLKVSGYSFVMVQILVLSFFFSKWEFLSKEEIVGILIKYFVALIRNHYNI